MKGQATQQDEDHTSDVLYMLIDAGYILFEISNEALLTCML